MSTSLGDILTTVRASLLILCRCLAAMGIRSIQASPFSAARMKCLCSSYTDAEWLMLRLSLIQELSHIDSVQILSNTHHIHDFEQVLTFHPRIKKGKQNICDSFYHLCLIILRSVLNWKNPKSSQPSVTPVQWSDTLSWKLWVPGTQWQTYTHLANKHTHKIKASKLINCVWGVVYMCTFITEHFLSWDTWDRFHHCLTTEYTLSDYTPKSNDKAYCFLPVHKTIACYYTKHCRQL